MTPRTHLESRHEAERTYSHCTPACRLVAIDLAGRIGISRTAVANWESSAQHTRPSSERLEDVAHVTNVSFERLATGRGQAMPSMESIPAADAELVDDPIERRLLEGFRAGNARLRQALLTIAEAQLPTRRAR